MAISTDNDKLAIMELDNWSEPGLPLSPGTLGTDDQQQLIMGYPGLAYSGAPALGVAVFSRVIGPDIGVRLG